MCVWQSAAADSDSKSEELRGAVEELQKLLKEAGEGEQVHQSPWQHSQISQHSIPHAKKLSGYWLQNAKIYLKIHPLVRNGQCCGLLDCDWEISTVESDFAASHLYKFESRSVDQMIAFPPEEGEGSGIARS